MIRKALIIEEASPLKGSFCIGGVPLVERSLGNLFSAGMEEIFILAKTGLDCYKKLTEKYSCVKLLNPGSSPEEQGFSGAMLVLHSDVLYESAVLTALLNDTRENLQIASMEGEESGIYRLSHDNACSVLVSAAIPCVSLKRSGILLWRRIGDEEQREKAEQELLPKITEADALRKVRREVLLNPGPATTSDSVKYAQVCPDICPREKEFGEVMEWICAELSLMAGKPGRVETVIFGGSGTAADEVMISSCVPDGAKLLIIDNGAYGERFARIAGVYKLNFEVYKSPGFMPLDCEEVKSKLLKGQFTHLAMVYHETTTGLLNPAPELCRFCREKGITTIVDAVSAFAAIPIDMDEDGFDFMASTSNKNIQGMAGVGFVFCRREALEKTASYPMRNYYLNLWDQYTHFKKTKQTRFTPPVQSLYALRQAIIETKLEGIKNRYARYSECWDILAASIKKMGLSMLVPEEAQSKLITAIIEPSSKKYSFEKLHDLARNSGFTIYPGKLSDANTFRIANIGDIRPIEMETFTRLLETYVRSL